jgi:hypothetical protein
MPVLDDTRIARLAARLDRRSIELAEAATRIRAGAEQLSWRGPAAQAAESSISGLLELLSRCHHRCVEAAASLRRHRSTAVHRMAALSALSGAHDALARVVG